MNKKKIYSDYLKKINLITKYNEAYYEQSDPKVIDEVYDDLKAEILSLEKNYIFLKSEDSPLKTVGY